MSFGALLDNDKTSEPFSSKVFHLPFTIYQLPAYFPIFFFIASVKAGTIANKSPTTP